MIVLGFASVSSETVFDHSLWAIVLTIAAIFVALSFARGPLSGSPGQAAALAAPLTLWVTGAEASGETQALAQQAATCWQLGGRQTNVGALPGGSVEAVGDFLRHTRGTSNDLLVLTSATLSDIAYEALRPPGSPAHAIAQAAARRLLEATPVAVLGEDSMSLAVSESAPIHSTEQLLAILRMRPAHPVLGVATEAWLEGGIASLAQSAGLEGEMPFNAYKSSAEALASLNAGEAEAVVAPHSALLAGLRRRALRELPWPRSSAGSDGWVAIMAPSGLNPNVIASLRQQAAQLCHGDEWQQRLRSDGLSPVQTGPRGLRDLIRSGLGEAGRVQALATHVVRDY